MMVATSQVLVFSSNINNPVKVGTVRNELLNISGVYSIHVDLEDWEYVLRVECHPEMQAQQIEAQIAQLGFDCAELPD